MGKQVNGRKRYIVVSIPGRLLAVLVHEADVQDAMPHSGENMTLLAMNSLMSQWRAKTR